MPDRRPVNRAWNEAKQRMEDVVNCGVQVDFRLGKWHYFFNVWPDCPPCTGSLFGCWHHAPGDMGLKEYEGILPLTKHWSIHFSAFKEKP